MNKKTSQKQTTNYPTFKANDIQVYESQLEINEFEEFYSEITAFKEYVLNIKSKCDTFDITIPSLNEKTEFINQNKPNIFSKFNQHFDYIYTFSKKLTKNDYKKLQSDYQSIFVPIFGTSPLNKMIYEKPLGYAGDFRMMKHYYNDDYSGDSTFDTLCHRYSLELPDSRANINRKEIFFKEIKESISKNSNSKIVSFGSGTAIEFIEVLKQSIPLKNAEFTFVDVEELAFEFIKLNIELHSKDNKNGKLNFLNLNLLKLLAGKEPPQELQKSDLIYACGIFDYFNEKLASKLLKLMYSLLNPKGKLIIANVAKGHNAIGYMEFLGDWVLHLRNEDDLKRLAEGIHGYKSLVTKPDPENGANIYLVIQK